MLYHDQDEEVKVQFGHVEVRIFEKYPSLRRVLLEVVETMNNIKQKDGPVCQKAIDRKL
jgi:hypothetical protein